ncbi:MAG: TonB-dependent receptor [Acidobacteria bacterium]|nr:TonB-dependent receptor [Acidobacteriota bacterium]
MAFLPEIHRLVSNYDNRADQIVNGRPIEMGTILIPLAQSYNYWYGLVRFDHHLMDRTNLTYRYLLDKRSVANSASNRQFGSRFAAASELFSQNHALSLTHAFSPRSMNEFRFAYIRNNVGFLENDPTNPTVQILNLFTIGGTSTFPAGRISNTFQWQDVTTTLHGRHSLKFGIDIRRNRLFNNAAFDSKGTWTFSNFVDFVNNRASNLRQSLLDASYDARQTNQSYFFQDDIRVKRNLNLNLGFRYEYSGVPFGFFGAANAEIAAAGVPLPAKPDRNNFAPRFGIAYSPTPREGWKNWLFGDGNTTFRAGFGVGYDVLFYNILTVTASNYPRVVKSDTVPSQNLFPTLAPKQTNIPPFDPLKTPLTSFTNASTDIQNPTTQFWSFSIQRQIRENYLLEIGYAGNRSYHLLRLGERNPGILTEEQVKTGKIPALQDRRLSPAWGARTTIESTALSEYHALFIRADRRMLSGLLFGASYAWSANFSDNDEPLGIGDIVLSSPWVPQDSFNYRNEWSRSVFDRPHRFVVHYSYEIPWLRSAGGYSPLLKHLFAGWRASGFTEWQSGQPFTVRTGVDSGGSGIPIGWRPDYNPNGIFEKDPVEGNLRTFKAPIAGGGIFVTPLTAGKLPLVNSMPRGGNLGRNTFRGPSYTMWNFSLAKQVAVSERVNLQLRADWFNLWNHHNFGNPVATMNSGADFGTNTTDPGGRTMLLNMKVSF